MQIASRGSEKVITTKIETLEWESFAFPDMFQSEGPAAQAQINDLTKKKQKWTFPFHHLPSETAATSPKFNLYSHLLISYFKQIADAV